MSRSFKDNADFKMNQQNFKLSDLGVEARDPARDFRQLRTTHNAVSGGFARSCSKIHAQQPASARARNGSAARHSGSGPGVSNLLPVRVAREYKSPSSRGSPASSRIVQNIAATEVRLSSSPSCRVSVSPPGYWKQYGGQESGVMSIVFRLIIVWSIESYCLVVWRHPLRSIVYDANLYGI